MILITVYWFMILISLLVYDINQIFNRKKKLRTTTGGSHVDFLLRRKLKTENSFVENRHYLC